jgi:hypothetical protein
MKNALKNIKKDPKGVVRSGKRRRTDNTVDNRKWSKGIKTIYKTLGIKLMIEQHEPN